MTGIVLYMLLCWISSVRSGVIPALIRSYETKKQDTILPDETVEKPSILR
jgi:hypothetical protein